VVHGDDHGAAGIPVHNAFQANLFTYHLLTPSRGNFNLERRPQPTKKAVVAERHGF
jgi:hypothetical protein